MKNKEIKVQLLASPHPQFDEILNFPPRGVKYVVNRVKTSYHGWFTEKKIELHNNLLKIFPLPRMARTKTDADLIHSTRGILQINQKKPWIVDCESGGVFTSFNYESLKNPITKKIISKLLSSKNCKKILPQSRAAKEDLLKALDCSKFKEKIEILYLAMRPCRKKRINRKDKKFVISFVGRYFYGKGGHDIIMAYERLSKKYKNLELKFKGDIPKEYKIPRINGLKIINGHLSREKLFDEMYLSADVFVLPTHTDNYGVVFLEAMSAGLPIIGTTSFTVPELIEDGKNGFLIKSPYSWENYLTKDGFDQKKFTEYITKDHPDIVKQIVDKVSILIDNKKLREKMGKESRRMIEGKNGKFSIERRNNQLKRIYLEALS